MTGRRDRGPLVDGFRKEVGRPLIVRGSFSEGEGVTYAIQELDPRDYIPRPPDLSHPSPTR